jgi:hypothetical protein
MTRLTHLALGAVLLLGLGVPASSAATPDKLLPAETDTVVSINLRQIIDSDVIKKYALEQIKQAIEGQEAKALLNDLGLDPLKDIDRMVVATIDTSRENTKFLLIVHGSFDPDKLFKTAEAQSKKDSDRFAMVRDGNIVMFKYQPETGDPPLYGTVVNANTVIAASEKKLIADALAAEKNGPAKLKPELTALLKKMDDKASMYAVSLVKGKFDDVQVPGGGNLPIDLSGIQKVLPSAETIAMTLKISVDVNLEVTFGMKDDEAATDMQNTVEELLKQLKPLAALAGAADERAKPLADILATVKTTAKNKDVIISGKIAGAAIAQMIRGGGE